MPFHPVDGRFDGKAEGRRQKDWWFNDLHCMEMLKCLSELR